MAPLLAGRPRVRESRGARHQYRRRWERDLTARLPAVPAAVPIYSAAGDTRVLVVDLDSAGGGVPAVQRDTAAVTELIRSAGGRVIVDESPSGGRHVYVPLAEPVGFHDARDLALAIATRTPSMDPSPNQNLTDGLIRPPGSRHHTGGHQRLLGPLADAQQLAATGNPPQVLHALQRLLAGELAVVRGRRQSSSDADPADDAGERPRRSRPRELAPDYLRIATTGLYDTARYASPSEARQAVLTAAVWAGLTLAGVAARVENGTWPGLASFYARYRPGTRRKALAADWRKATAWVDAQHGKQQTADLVRNSPTSEPPPHGGRPLQDQKERAAAERARGTAAEYQWIRSWRNAAGLLEHTRYPDRGGLGVRWVLRAVGEAAMKTGSRYIAFGTRSLSVATGLDHTTVAAHLRRLRDEDDPLIDLIENDRGLAGDLYQLRIPDEAAARTATMAWPAGQLHALRPAFRELGHPAAFVYEALEHTREPVRSFDLVAGTGLSRSAVYEALETLAAWNLVTGRSGRWTLNTATSLTQLAEQFGCLDAVRAQVQRHRRERAAYRLALRIVDRHEVLVDTVADPDEPYEWPPEPPPEEQTLFDLLERELGAHPVSTTVW
ncbi:MAG TPA: helix-turn-helix domain-containing protein [Nakamurella sp.]